MAKFKITKTTTVAKLKEWFRDEFGGTLRVYEGRSEAAEDATLVSIGGKVGELECRASRTVGKFEEAFQTELGLKVKVYPKDNNVSVLDGITLSKVKDIPNMSTHAKMEQFLSYKRDEAENNDAVEDVEIPDEIKGIPLFDIHMKKVEWPFMSEEEIDEHSDELGAFGVVLISGDNENGDFQYYVFAGDTDEGMYEAVEFIDWAKEEYDLENFEANISDSIKIYGLDKQDYELASDIQQGLIAQTGCEYCRGEWSLEYPALFRVNFGTGEPTVFSITEKGYFKKEYSNNVFDKLVELTESGLNDLKSVEFKVDPHDCEFYEGLSVVQKGDKYGFCDKNYNMVVDFIYDEANYFREGLASVKKNGKWGFIDKNGNVVLDFVYDDAGNFSCGIVSVKKDGKYMFINPDGSSAM